MDRKKPSRKAEPPSKRRIAWPRWTGFRGMTVRDWLQLLVVPLALVVIGFWFTMQQDARQQRIETQRAEAERELAEQRAQDEALQAYLDQMSTLLLERNLRLSTEKNATEDSKEARSLARARTLTVLSRLDPERKTQVMQFLAEAELIQTVEGREPVVVQPVVVLAGAELSGAKLYGAQLYGAELVGAELSWCRPEGCRPEWGLPQRRHPVPSRPEWGRPERGLPERDQPARCRPEWGTRHYQRGYSRANLLPRRRHHAQRPEVRGLAQEQGQRRRGESIAPAR